MKDVTFSGLLGEFKNYLRDASPGGLLNPEITPERMRNALEYTSMTPTPFGDAASGLLAGNYLMKGQFKDAGLEAIGLLPFVPGMIKYHGSNNVFNKFLTSSDSANDMGILGNVPTKRFGAFLTNNPKYAAEYGDVTKWSVKPKKTAPINQQLRDEFIGTIDPFEERDLWLQAKYGSNKDWGLFENDLGERFVNWLKSKGFDSAKFKEYTTSSKTGKDIAGETFVILDPEIASKL